jgi:hypothetical protein
MVDNDVDAWLARYTNPMKPVLEHVRQIIRHADERICESVHDCAPTWAYEGNLVSIAPEPTTHVSLMFHQGATIPGDFPHLEGTGKNARVMSIVSTAEAESRRDELNAIVAAWIDSRDRAAESPSTR